MSSLVCSAMDFLSQRVVLSNVQALVVTHVDVIANDLSQTDMMIQCKFFFCVVFNRCPVSSHLCACVTVISSFQGLMVLIATDIAFVPAAIRASLSHIARLCISRAPSIASTSLVTFRPQLEPFEQVIGQVDSLPIYVCVQHLLF